jgi:hypothetical protein
MEPDEQEKRSEELNGRADAVTSPVPNALSRDSSHCAFAIVLESNHKTAQWICSECPDLLLIAAAELAYQ